MRWLWLAGMLAAGCSPYRRPLVRGTFLEVCPGGLPEVAQLDFLPDHTFRYSYPKPDAWTGDGNERWWLRGDRLTVSWNDGFAVSRYRLAEATDAGAPGRTTKVACPGTIQLRPDPRSPAP
ncbi:MAG: hypothetical protein RLZZ383_2531 [Pseudomonadota bacterium]